MSREEVPVTVIGVQNKDHKLGNQTDELPSFLNKKIQPKWTMEQTQSSMPTVKQSVIPTMNYQGDHSKFLETNIIADIVGILCPLKDSNEKQREVLIDQLSKWHREYLKRKDDAVKQEECTANSQHIEGHQQCSNPEEEVHGKGMWRTTSVDGVSEINIEIDQKGTMRICRSTLNQNQPVTQQTEKKLKEEDRVDQEPVGTTKRRSRSSYKNYLRRERRRRRKRDKIQRESSSIGDRTVNRFWRRTDRVKVEHNQFWGGKSEPNQ